MTALMVDYIAIMVWMNSKDGAANRKRPDRLPRPGDKPKSTRLGNAQMTLKQAKEWLGW